MDRIAILQQDAGVGMRSFFKSILIIVAFVLAGAPRAAFAQKAVLYEEDYGNRYVGSVIWRTETVSPPGQPSERTISAEIEVPERKLVAKWSLRRNNDRTLEASHIVEITFNLPAGHPSGPVVDVPRLFTKLTEQARGVPLFGPAVKVIDGTFMIGLSNIDWQRHQNLEFLKRHEWFDIPMVYSNKRRAVLAVEKGAAGTRVFGDVLAAWGQSEPVTRPSTPDSPPPAQRRTSIGTGFILTTAGHVLTNSHVVAGCVSIGLKTRENSATPARVIAREEIDDLVVLKTDARLGVAATLRMSPSPRTGEAIVVFGFPLSGLLASTGNVTIGNITALAGLRDDSRQLQISAPVQPGNSGGPVLDMSGNVIGVVVSKLDALRVASPTFSTEGKK